MHLVLLSSNPNNKNWENPGKAGTPFKECNHFSMCNEYLVRQGKRPINWKLRK